MTGFWRDRRVLLTGHTGFKGAWLAIWLRLLGAQVTGYALAPSTPSLFELARVTAGMRSIIGNIQDLGGLRRAMALTEPEIVLHLAAQSLVTTGYREPVETYATNVMGTVHVLEATRTIPSVRAAVIVTTDKCYENQESARGYREDDPLGGYDPYSSSKAAAELVSAAYRSSYFNAATYPTHGIAVATVRAGNVIGGGDWSRDRLVPDVLRAVEAGVPVLLRNPEAVRPWQHVLDPLHGYLLLAERLVDGGPEFAEAWNFGPDDADVRPASWIAQELVRRLGHAPGWRHEGPSPMHETQCLKLDSSKARGRLGWRPRLTLERGLDWTAAWHRQHRQGADVSAICEQQLEAFAQLGAA